MNGDTQSAGKKAKSRIQEKLMKSSFFYKSERQLKNIEDIQDNQRDRQIEQSMALSCYMSAQDSNDDLLNSLHFGLSEYEFKDI